MAIKWANKSFSLNHATELIYTQISDNKEKIKNVSWCMYWFLDNMYWMAASLVYDNDLGKDDTYKQKVFETVSTIFDVVYKNDDMSFEMMNLSFNMHREIIKLEIQTTKNMEIIKSHLIRCFDLALKSKDIKEHKMKSPLLEELEIQSAPTNNMKIIDILKEFLSNSYLDEYREQDWFKQLLVKLI